MTDMRMEDALAEIERLTHECKTWHDCYDNERRRNERLAADEIERLREHIDALRLVATSHEPEALRQQAEIERLRGLVKDLADDLEAELNGRYPPNIRAYPSEQRRYERDMANVYEARRALEHKP